MQLKWAGRQRVRWVSLAALVVIAALILVATGAVRRDRSQAVGFYQPPLTSPRHPGQLVRAERYDNGIPAVARAWRILYTTTRSNGSPALASAIVVASRAASSRPEPVVVWAHGTTGFARSCAPSLHARPFDGGIGQDVAQLIRRHWVYVAPDYTGLGTPGPQPYLIGQGEARSVLDAVRAVRHLKQLSVSDRAVVWGHSQGGGAALWAGQIQPAYAPDITLAGVAAIAPTSNVPAFVAHLNTRPAGRDLMAYVVTSYAAAYPDVKAADYLEPAAVPVVQQIAQRCGETTHLVLLKRGIPRSLHTSLLDRSPNTGPLGARLRQNTPTSTGGAPLLLAQGDADATVLPAMQRAYARMLCARGTRLDYREYPGRTHSGVEDVGAPLIAQLLAWTGQRLAGEPFTGNCRVLVGHGRSGGR